MSYERGLADVVETMRSVRDRRRACTLLIGAGCSVTAGIPTAGEFVEIVRKSYERSYARAASKTYPHVMAALSPAERQGLIADHVDEAGINWAHIGIAELMKHGYIDRVLTTNFDPLVVRAAALTGVYPAVYDFAASQAFSAADLPDNAVFHLHGQRTGFALMNTTEEVARHSEFMKPVFEDAGRGRAWLVVGYSGENDPVFDHLARVPRFDDRLYWVGYRDADPPDHVRTQLLDGNKYAFWVRGFDADSFFISLARELDCFPPAYIGKPFSHLGEALKHLRPYPVQQLGDREAEVQILPSDDGRAGQEPGSRRSGAGAARTLGAQASVDDDVKSDITQATYNAIKDAIDQHEVGERSPLGAWSLFLAGKYDEVVAVADEIDVEDDFCEPAYWSYLEAGRHALEDARQESDWDLAREMLERADRMFAAAADIKPAARYRYEDWGETLSRMGQHDDAMKRFTAGLAADPDNHRLLARLGLALRAQSYEHFGDLQRKRKLLEAAIKRLGDAAKLRPGDHAILNDWGTVLLDHADAAATKRTKIARYRRALEKFEEALESSPEAFAPVILVNTSFALQALADLATGDEAAALLETAVEHVERAYEIQPDDASTRLQLARALAIWADAQDSAAAREAYDHAIEHWMGSADAAPWVHTNVAAALMRSTRTVGRRAAANRLASAADHLDEAEEYGAVEPIERFLLALYRGDDQVSIDAEELYRGMGPYYAADRLEYEQRFLPDNATLRQVIAELKAIQR